MNFLHTVNRLKAIRAKVHPIINTREYSMKDIDQDIKFLSKLFEDHIEDFNAEEQNKIVNLIQKLILIRDMKKAV